MNALFDIPENKSPRLKWIEKHGIKTARIVYFVESGREPEWNAWASSQGETLEDAESMHKPFVGRGQSQDDALADWARKNKVRLWNEEI